MKDFDIQLVLIFRGAEEALPPTLERCQQAYLFAGHLQKVGFPMERWLLKASSRKAALLHRAFGESGPSSEFVTMTQRDDTERAVSSESVWNGAEGVHASDFALRFNLNGLCHIQLNAENPAELSRFHATAELIESLLEVWPARLIQVGSSNYRIGKRVFPDRPGVGWMLYLPRRIEHEQVPEAAMIRHVKDPNGTEGTIIISVIDEPFDIDNAEHVRVANAIEIRLADQGLLPRYADL